MVILVVMSWDMYSWLEGAVPGCHQHCTETFLGQENMSSPIPASQPLWLSQAPHGRRNMDQMLWGGRRGFRGCCTFHLNQTPTSLQLSVHYSH